MALYQYKFPQFPMEWFGTSMSARHMMSSIVDTFLPIQSIVVVTSPIGDQAPPLK